MKRLIPVVLALALPGCTGKQSEPAVLRDLPSQVRAFVVQQEQYTRQLAGKLEVEPDRATLKYFRLAKQGRYRAASRIYQDLRERGGKVESPRHDPELRLPLWDPLVEVQLVLDAYAAGAGRFATAFGEGIVQSIPPGSIYLGGTDTGRGLPAAFCRLHVEGDPIFVLTQNQMVDGQHLIYLRATFGDKIRIPSNEDSQRAFQEYLDDAARRYEHDRLHPGEPSQLRPGENVQVVDGKARVAGQVAVMVVNGLLVKSLFEQNPDREFYIEESFPLDWMYPHLTPHGLIMKINREPVAELPPELVAKDHQFWSNQLTEFIGDWLKSDTAVEEVCGFVEKIFLRKDLAGFQGQAEFTGNDYATAAYSKLRSSQGGVYAWRVQNSKSAEERDRMMQEADFAFRQAFAICPTSPEAVFRYVNLLVQGGRLDAALLIGRTSAKLKPGDGQLESLVRQLENIKKSG